MFRRRKFPSVGGNSSSRANTDGNTGRLQYDAKWDRLSIRFRRQNPFCRFCEQDGYEASPADDADHVIPLRAPFNGAKYDWKNLQPLCRKHHYGLKAKLEHYAEKNGQFDMLRTWCEDPASRPDMTQRLSNDDRAKASF